MAAEITRENSIPRRSANYYSGEAVLRRQFNDVDFYFEDKDQQELYFSIMKKLFGNVIVFEKVFITCGKDKAYELAKRYKNNKRKLFIVDKDFDDLLRTKKRGIENLFYLERYCLENFLIERDALLWTILFQKPQSNRNEIALQYDEIFNEVAQELQLLSCYFFIAKKYKIHKYINGFKSCSIPVDFFLHDTERWRIDSSKADAYWRSIEQAIIDNIPNKNPSDLLESAKKSINFNILGTNGIYKNIPGKHFLELLRKKLVRLYPFMNTMKTSQMKFALADKCEFLSLGALKRDISAYLEIA